MHLLECKIKCNFNWKKYLTFHFIVLHKFEMDWDLQQKKKYEEVNVSDDIQKMLYL